jgi:transcriptional regulator with XRE-family HTH domain
MDDPQAVGRRIRAARRGRGLSQVDLASLCGVSQRQISELERGKIPGVTAHNLSRIAQGLGVSVDTLLYGQEEER